MAKRIHLPILRMGRPYESMDRLDLDAGEYRIEVSLANPGLIRRDLMGIGGAREALRRQRAQALAVACERAADAFLNERLPWGCGDDLQGPEDYVRALSVLTGLPHSLCRSNMRKIHGALANMSSVVAGLTRGLPWELFDTGVVSREGLAINYFPAAESLGVSLPSNSPGVNSLWLPAPVFKVPVLLKPGREDPLTPYRLIQALVAGGFPAEAFGFYPTTHEGGDTLLLSCGRGIAFGSDATVKRYAAFDGIQVHGTGRSKVLLGDDWLGRWESQIDVLVESISANGGRSCINASAIFVPGRRDEIADELARRLAGIEPLPRDHPDALLCGFANPEQARAIDARIEAELRQPGAEDVTARYRKGPRLAEAHGQTFLRPTLVVCDDLEHPLANTEFMFPYASLVEMPAAQMLPALGPTLVVSALTGDPRWIAEIVACPWIDRLNVGPFPTNRVQWEQPHEGNLFEFLFRRRALQGDLGVMGAR